VSADKIKKIKDDIRGHLDKGLEEAKSYKPTDSEWLSSKVYSISYYLALSNVINSGLDSKAESNWL